MTLQIEKYTWPLLWVRKVTHDVHSKKQQRYLRRQTTPQQMMVRHTARPTNPTAITAATETVIVNNLSPTQISNAQT